MKSTSKLIIFIFTFLALAASADAQSPREQLQQMVEQLQKRPTDNALRERIIKLGAEITPAPAVPPEAKRPFVMAGTYQKEAKKPSDFALAIDAYQDALKIAPWWGDAYYNLSVSLESAGELDKAKDALNLYLLTKPKDAEEAQNRLYALDAKNNLVAKQSGEAASEKAAKGDSRLVGFWTYAFQGKPSLISGTTRHMDWTISATGSGQYEAHLSKYAERAEWGGYKTFAFALRGGQVEGSFYWNGRGPDGKQLCAPITSTLTGTLSQDGKALDLKYQTRLDHLGCKVGDDAMTLMRLE